jgi:hypothetical protein
MAMAVFAECREVGESVVGCVAVDVVYFESVGVAALGAAVTVALAYSGAG